MGSDKVLAMDHLIVHLESGRRTNWPRPGEAASPWKLGQRLG